MQETGCSCKIASTGEENKEVDKTEEEDFESYGLENLMKNTEEQDFEESDF